MIVWHSGYREQPRNGPNRPRRAVIAAPHSGQGGDSSSIASAPSPGSERLPRQSGNPAHPRNFSPPLQRSTSGLPQSSHPSAVGRPLMRGISTIARSSVFENSV